MTTKPTREETIAFIEYATRTLAGPMSNIERALMVADRKDARDHLTKLDAGTAALAPVGTP